MFDKNVRHCGKNTVMKLGNVRLKIKGRPEERSMKILFRDIAASSMIRFITRRLQFENLM